MEKMLPPIPAKRYFTIGEVSELCGVKPYVLRYWEQEFTQLKPMKRRGNRRYYQHHEVLLIRRIRELLYDQGFTIIGARNRLGDAAAKPFDSAADADADTDETAVTQSPTTDAAPSLAALGKPGDVPSALDPAQLRAELLSIRELLSA
jgi:DNA-binding transcriptional MerR regulator